MEGEQMIGALEEDTTIITIGEGEASPESDPNFGKFKRKRRKMFFSKPKAPPVSRPEGSLMLAQVKQEHFDNPVHRGKYIKEIPTKSPKQKKKKHSGGSSRSSSKDTSGERKKPRHKSPSPQKEPSSQGK